MRNRAIIILVTLLSVGACKPVTSVAPDSDFNLAVGQRVRIAGSDISVTFMAVGNDSRCPVDVVCVHAGNAEVQLEAQDSSAKSNLVLNSFSQPRAVTFRDYTISLVSLAPAPRSAQPIRPQDYRARLHLARN